MKRVTKNNLLKLVKMKKEYIKTGEEHLIADINEYINKDKRYYRKLQSYEFDEETIKYLM